MSLVPGIPNPYLEAFAGGLFYGSVFCTASCLPYVASYIAGIGASFRKSVFITLTYNSGRLLAYALIGGAIGVLSGVFSLFVSEASLLSFQAYSSIAFGVVTMAIGISMLFKRQPSLPCNRIAAEGGNLRVEKQSGRFDVRAFSLGLSRGLILCPPLLALLLASLLFATPIETLILAVLFGLGTTLSPMLLLGGVTGWLLEKAPLFRKWISICGAGILIVLGASALLIAIIAAPRQA